MTAALKEYLLNVQIAQHSQLRRMAQRLSMFTHLGKFSAPEPPRWRAILVRTAKGRDFSAFQSALDFGDAEGPAISA